MDLNLGGGGHYSTHYAEEGPLKLRPKEVCVVRVGVGVEGRRERGVLPGRGNSVCKSIVVGGWLEPV